MTGWRSFVNRLMAMSAMIELGNTPSGLVVSRLPRVPETPNPRPVGMATEYERNIKPPKKGKGTRKQRKEESIRWKRREVALNTFYRWQILPTFVATRYGSKAHRRALAKLNQ